MIKALLCDLDGTLFLEHGKTVFELSKRNQKALAALKENRIALYPNSGRMVSFGAALLKQYGFTDIRSAGLNGALGIDNGKTVWQYDVPVKAVRKALKILNESHIHYRTAQIQTLEDVRVFSDLSGPDVIRYKSQAAQLGIGFISDTVIHEFLDDPKGSLIGKLSVRFHENDTAACTMKLLRNEMPECCVTMSDRNLVDVMSPLADKANMIAYLIEKCSFCKEEIAAVGDGLNDLSMIQNAGLSFAMENGSDELKVKADYVVKDVCACCELILNRKIGD